MAARTLELSQFIAREGLAAGAGGGCAGVGDLPRLVPHAADPGRARERARRARRRSRAWSCARWSGTDVCCGFGGTFSVNFPEVSGRLGEEKARAAAATGADELVACDVSCLLHIAGRARRTGVPLRVRHLAEVLAG